MDNVPTNEELVALFDKGEFAREMARRFGLKDKAERQLVCERCAALHNSGAFDLFQLIESNALQELEGTNFFAALRIICQILPGLEESPSRMMACIEALVNRRGEDMSFDHPNGAFRDWCKKHPQQAREVITAACEGDELSKRHLTFALEAINAIAEARQIALAYDDMRRLCAITALGRMEEHDPASLAETFATFELLLDSGADDDLLANLLGTFATILERCQGPATLRETTLLGRLVENAGDSTLHQAAYILWANKKILNPEIVAILLQALARINPANKGTVNALDNGLQALLELGYDNMAVDFITELLTQPDNNLGFNEFDSFANTLVSSKPERLSRVIVKWLLLGESPLCDGLANSIRSSDLEGSPLYLQGAVNYFV